MEKLTERGCVPKELQRIERHDDQREAPAEIEVAAVGFNPVDAQSLALRLALGLFQHGSRDVEAGDIDARCRQRDCHPSRAAADLQNRSGRRLRLRQVEGNVILGFERIVVASVPDWVEVRHFSPRLRSLGD
jgi:hypothetical protein